MGGQEENVVARIAAIAGKADGLILHDQMLSKIEIARLADVVPIVTLAGNPSSASINVRCDNGSGMRALIHQLLTDHGYRNLAYLSVGADRPRHLARARVP